MCSAMSAWGTITLCIAFVFFLYLVWITTES